MISNRFLFAKDLALLQMANFVGGDDNATIASAVLNNRNTVDLLKSFVDYTRPADVSKASRSAITASTFIASPTHVELGDYYSHIVGWQSIFTVQIFAHVS